ncbi:hypothetical protein DdX_14766 [Ditylenchus destructor]|uniref:Uncharacterized protein n=1 Tax=Ditylenchus destructor TaxID=166010 RepID=A0AAD4QYA2_9BILA|nr:hypothetical protein DdX_14766 [Ditylenchus destructor]
MSPVLRFLTFSIIILLISTTCPVLSADTDAGDASKVSALRHHFALPADKTDAGPDAVQQVNNQFEWDRHNPWEKTSHVEVTTEGVPKDVARLYEKDKEEREKQAKVS